MASSVRGTLLGSWGCFFVNSYRAAELYLRASDVEIPLSEAIQHVRASDANNPLID